MGAKLCSCSEDGLKTQRKQERADKIRPFLLDLQEDFSQHSGEDKQLDQEELLTIWKKSVERHVGKLTEESLELLKTSVGHYFQEMDHDRSGTITESEFIAHMLGGMENRGPLQNMRQHINDQVAQDPDFVHRMVEQFTSWDRDGDGFVTPEEFEEHLKDLEKMTGHEAKVQEMRELRLKIFAEADINKDGKIDLWEAMAYTLGRRRTPVEILIYDVSKGWAEKLGTLVAGRKLQAVHTGVLTFGSEYWYGGKIFRSKAPCAEIFGKPVTSPWGTPLEKSLFDPELPVVHVGYTFMNHTEFTRWLKTKAPEYTREKYDLLTHSCNHFTNEAVLFLTGKSVPDKVMELQKLILKNKGAALRPYLNRYLNCFADCDKRVTDDYFAEDYNPEHYKNDLKDLTEDLGEGTLHVINGDFVDGIDGEVVATIVKDDGDDKVTIRFFDMAACKVATMGGVSKLAIRKDADATKSCSVRRLALGSEGGDWRPKEE